MKTKNTALILVFLLTLVSACKKKTGEVGKVSPTPAASASPSPTAFNIAGPATPPPVSHVNGCQHPGTGGECGFTIFFECPGCSINRAWPCDQGHAWWTVPPFPSKGSCDDLGDCSTWGSCAHANQTAPNSDAAAMCGICKSSAPGYARIWDATCGSIGNSFIRVLSGNLQVNVSGRRNCYAKELTGHGTYQVCLPAGAKACIDPRDYLISDQDPRSPYRPNGTCPNGEVVLTDHDICSRVLTF